MNRVVRKCSGEVRREWLLAIRAGVIGLGVHLLAASAYAQTPGQEPKQDSGVLQWGIAAGLVVVVCATAFLNPKRSHLT